MVCQFYLLYINLKDLFILIVFFFWCTLHHRMVGRRQRVKTVSSDFESQGLSMFFLPHIIYCRSLFKENITRHTQYLYIVKYSKHYFAAPSYSLNPPVAKLNQFMPCTIMSCSSRVYIWSEVEWPQISAEWSDLFPLWFHQFSGTQRVVGD